MEWDDYLRQQAATYRQLAEKAEDAVVKTELLDLADGVLLDGNGNIVRER